MVYLDASVLVSAFQQDSHSSRVDAWFASGADFVLSSWAIAEVSSALGVQVRMKRLTARQRSTVETRLDAWLDNRPVVDAHGDDFRLARTLLQRDLRLRAPDALHLAIISRLRIGLATLDLEMAEAARDCGLSVLVL